MDKEDARLARFSLRTLMLVLFKWLWEKDVRRFFWPLVRNGRLWWLTIWFSKKVEVMTIVLRDEGRNRSVGCIGSQEVEPGVVEIGSAVGIPALRDRGIGTKAASIYLGHLGRREDVSRAIARVLPTNGRAIKTLEKLGFVEEASDDSDIVEFSIMLNGADPNRAS